MSNRRTAVATILVCAILGLATITLAEQPPNRITIKSLENLYGPAAFDHKKHTDAGFECKKCHHKPFGKTIACKDCHSEQVDKKGFSHEKHWRYSDCADCHQAETSKSLACSNCHKIPFDKKQPQVIGLKGALHAQCMGCHKESGVPNSCTDCHAKKK